MSTINFKKYATLVVGIAALSLAGCVSTSTHEKMQAEKNSEITALQQEKAALEQQSAELQKQRSELEKQSAALEAEIAKLQQQTASLEKDKSNLENANRQRKAQYDRLARQMSAEVQKGELKVRQYQNMLSVDVAEQMFFDSGRAKIKSSGQDVLKKLGEALKEYDDKVIRVVGHTDNVPVAKSLQAKYPTNWELSVARATNVVHALQDAGVAPERLVASGRGEYEPIAPNDTAENKQKNRRIEIMLIDAHLVDEITKQREQQ
ncbi:MAG: OmpA family protein [Gammaproteobacteria bacterium]|nr:OmpA family protein [Gammaproteobacteria bacterium]